MRNTTLHLLKERFNGKGLVSTGSFLFFASKKGDIRQKDITS